MTSTSKVVLCIGIILSFLSVSSYAQSAGPELSHFAAGEISLDYPSGFSLADESTPEAQQFVITRKGSSVQLTIRVTRHLVLETDLPTASETFRERLLKAVVLTFGQGKNPPERTSFQTQIGTQQAEGIRLRSTRKTGEVIWGWWNLHLVGFAFVRLETDESVGAQLWQTVSSSLAVKAPLVTVMGTGAQPTEGTKIEGGVLNGKALALPYPPYPALARKAHVAGTVIVQVLIDEEGNVIEAHAVDGHPLLQAACVAAARQARFSPTRLSGVPVRVTGVIQYNFVAQ